MGTVPIPEENGPIILIATDGQTVIPYALAHFDPNRIRLQIDGMPIGNGWVNVSTPYDSAAPAMGYTGGTITLSSGIREGVRIIIYYEESKARLTSYPDSGVRVAALNREFARVWMVIHEVLSAQSRALQMPLADGKVSGLLPEVNARANRLLSFDAKGQPVATLGESELGDIVNEAATTVLVARDQTIVASAAASNDRTYADIAAATARNAAARAAASAVAADAHAATLEAAIIIADISAPPPTATFDELALPCDLGGLLGASPFAVERVTQVRIDLARDSGNPIDLGDLT